MVMDSDPIAAFVALVGFVATVTFVLLVLDRQPKEKP